MSHEREWLFAVAAISLVLLFVGIHNSWDAVSYHVLVGRREDAERRGSRS
jgi:hypothetical protein